MEREYTSWSEVSTARQCLRKHDLTYKQGWRDLDPHPALDRGTRWHSLMEVHHSPDSLEVEAYELIDQWFDEGEIDDDECSLLLWMFQGYVERYGTEEQDWEVVEIEKKVEVHLPDIGYGPLKLLGYVDLLVRIGGQLWVVDHKTGSRGKPSLRELEMADQWSLYCYALRELGYDVFGSMHNYAATKRLKRAMSLEERFTRTPIFRTPRELTDIAQQVSLQAWHARLDNGAPQNPGEHCFWRCGFSDYCVADRRYGSNTSGLVLRQKFKKKEDG